MKNTPADVGGSGTRSTPGEEVSLSDLLLVLWQCRYPVLGVAAAAAALAFVVSWTMPPVYEASSRLLVAAPKLAGADESRRTVSSATYQALISNQSLILEVLNDLRLTGPPHQLTAADALQRNVSVQAIGNGEFILVTTRLGDAALAAQFANRLAEGGVRRAQQAAQDDGAAARDLIKVELDAARKRLEEAEGRLLAYRKQAQVEALAAEVDVMIQERAKLLPLTVQIEAERARIRQTTEELAAHAQVRTGSRPAAPAVSRKAAPATPSQSLPIQDEQSEAFVNPLYESLNQQLADSRTRLSELESQHAQILRATDLTKGGAKKLNELYTSQAELDRLNTEIQIARDAYGDLTIRYEQARIQVAARSPQLQIIDVAVPPANPVSPRTFRNTAIALVLGAVLASVAVVFYSAISGEIGLSARRQ